MKKQLALSMSAAMALTLLAGCGGSGSSSSAAASGSDTAEAAATGAPTITFMMPTFYGTEFQNENSDQVIQAYTDYTGINVEWRLEANDTYKDKFGLTLMDKDNMPMVLTASGALDANIVDAAKAGAFWDLSPYLEDSTAYPNLSQANKDVLKGLTVNSQVIGLPRTRSIGRYGLAYRTDWAEAVGITEPPETIEDVYNMLYAFTYNDPDGNGKNDTYGLSGAGINGFSAILMAFGVAEPNNFIIRDGQLVFSAIDDGMKDAVTFIKKMVDAGVVDPEMMTNGSSEHRDKAIRGEVGMVWIDLWNMHKQVYADQIKAINPNAEWILLDGVEGPGGKYAYSNPTASATRYYALSADLEDEPEKLAAAIQLLNYLSNPTTGGRLVSFGIEGVHYELGENDAIIALPAMNDLTYSWVYQLTGREDYDYLCAKFGYAREFIDYIASDSISLLNTYNGAVSAPETVNVADIERYAEEELTRFIYGERSLDEWDSYVATLRNVYGLDAYIAKAESDLKTAGYLE